jgi:PPOX class probable F420-dependent enzyme
MEHFMKISAANLPHLLAAAVLLAAFATPAATAIAATSPRDADALAKSTYIYIATVRKDGNQSKAVPVWFITTADGRIMIDTNSDSWKAKRIRRGSPVLVWIGSRTGPAFIGKAEFIRDRALQDEMIEGIPRKYWLAWAGLFGPKRARFDSGQVVTLRISPERDLPDGFQSAPGTPAPVLDEKPKPAAAQ